MNDFKMITPEKTYESMDWSEVKRVESLCRSMGWNYTIFYADGTIVTTKISRINMEDDDLFDLMIKSLMKGFKPTLKR